MMLFLFLTAGKICKLERRKKVEDSLDPVVWCRFSSKVSLLPPHAYLTVCSKNKQSEYFSCLIVSSSACLS